MSMRKFTTGRVMAGTLLFALLLTGCGQTAGTEAGSPEPEVAEALHEHTWAEATCTEPKKCTECGESEGEPLGHDWTEATCDAPKTCSRCGVTEGEPLGHEWTFATLDAPRTCKKCGATEGKPVSVHVMNLKDVIGDGWNLIRPIRESIVCEKYDNNTGRITVNVYDYEGNLLNEIHNDIPYYQFSYGVAIPYQDKEHIKVAFMIAVLGDGEEKGTIDVYSPLGEQLASFDVPWSVGAGNDHLTMTTTEDPRYLACFLSEGREVVYYLDTEKVELLDASLLDLTLKEEPEYDKSKYSVCVELQGDGLEGYLVANADQSKWGYVDGDFNEIAMYEDATGYNLYGYALVSEGNHTYDIIDADHNIVAKDFATGDGAYVVGGSYGSLIGIRKADGQEDAFLIR